MEYLNEILLAGGGRPKRFPRSNKKGKLQLGFGENASNAFLKKLLQIDLISNLEREAQREREMQKKRERVRNNEIEKLRERERKNETENARWRLFFPELFCFV